MGKNRPGGAARERADHIRPAQPDVPAAGGAFSEIVPRRQDQLRAGKRRGSHAKDSERAARRKIYRRSPDGRVVELRRFSRRRARAAPAAARSARDLRRFRLVAEKTLVRRSAKSERDSAERRGRDAPDRKRGVEGKR